MNEFIKKIKKLFQLLDKKERNSAFLLMSMIIIMALLDMIGVASIMPFLTLLANPELVETNSFLRSAFLAAKFLGIDDVEHFQFALGLLLLILLVASLAFKALTNYVQLRFTLMREYSIGVRLIEGYLRQPYSWFLNRHSADLGKNILSEVTKVIFSFFNPLINLFAQGAVTAALLILLLITDPTLALVICATLTATYAFIFSITRSFIFRIGQESVTANMTRFSVISEAFGSYKEVKVGGLEQAYVHRFSVPAQTYAHHQANVQIISQLPRFALEAIAFGGMLVVVLFLMVQRGNFANAIPTIGLYAFVGYRLMPSLQQIYGAVTQLRFAGPSLDLLSSELLSLQPPLQSNQSQESLMLSKAITLKNVIYRYPGAPHPTLKGLNLTIAAKSTVAFIGATGSGKTTTVDLILGLLEPQEGTLEIDGLGITDVNRRAWQRSIGYVPQNIYLADDTVAANIAFGVEEKYIDHQAVERAARIANLHEFVFNELPLKYQTTVGERGVRLSGGQRQRIGIARALYYSPQILILDEATSALDNLTEQAVMEAVYNLGQEITIILIAHRLSIVKTCDTIFLLEKGELKGQGSFDDLIRVNESFRAMVQTN